MNINEIHNHFGNVNIFISNESLHIAISHLIFNYNPLRFGSLHTYTPEGNKLYYEEWLKEMKDVDRFLLLYPEDRTSNAHVFSFADRFFSCLDFADKTVFVATYSDTFLGQAFVQMNKKSNTADIRVFWIYEKDGQSCFYLFTEEDIDDLQEYDMDIWLNYQKYLPEVKNVF